MKHHFILLLLAISTSTLLGQDTFNSDQLKSDLTVMGNIFTGLSPKLSDADRTRIDQLIELKQDELEGQQLSTMDFFKFISKIDFKTKFDEHASISLTEEVFMPMLTKVKLFPLPIKFLESSMYVNNSNSEIAYGARIYSINDIPVDSLLRSLVRNFDDTYSKRNLERQFSILYLIIEGSFESFQIEYALPDKPDEKLQTTIQGIDFDRYKSVFNEAVFPLNKSSLQNLTNTNYYKESRTYYLQLNSFNWAYGTNKSDARTLGREHKRFKKQFDIIFKDILELGAENLIIDLRYNMGGNVKVPAVLYSYIARDPFVEEVNISIPDFDFPNIELVTKISGKSIDDSEEVYDFIKKYKKKFTEDNDSSYVWNFVEESQVSPAKNAFTGNVYLLVSGQSISASAYFAALVKSHQRGLILGEEMGGSYNSLTAGHFLTYQLPNTKLELRAPLMEVNLSNRLNEKIKSNRIKPDIDFSEHEQFEYFILEKDIELEKTLEVIKAETE